MTDRTLESKINKITVRICKKAIAGLLRKDAKNTCLTFYMGYGKLVIARCVSLFFMPKNYFK